MASWKDVGKFIMDTVAVLGGLLTNPFGTIAGMAGSMASKALGVDSTPEAVDKAVKEDPEAFLKLKQMVLDHETEIQSLHLQALMSTLTEETKRLTETNITMRAEYASDDKYVRRWRPFFGYNVAVTRTVQITGLTAIMGWAVIYHAAEAGVIIGSLTTAVTSLTTMWGIALAVLGVSVRARSKDKQTRAINNDAIPSPELSGNASVVDKLISVFKKK